MTRIYTKVVMDWGGNILEAESFDYSGPIAECKGGGSSTTNTVDKAYNKRMAKLSEEQQDWARVYFKKWKKYDKPYEIQQSKINMEMLPLESSVYKQQLTAANSLIPQQAKAGQQFLSAAANGVNINERMGLATADAANAWKDVSAVTAREQARMGINPNSGRFQGTQAALNTQKAAQMAGARTQARVGAEEENYNRLRDAASYNGANSILQGVGFTNSSST